MELATSSSKLGITSLQPKDCDKLKGLWESLFDANAVSENYEDKDLQSAALLTGTVFTIFKGLKEKYEDAQKECKKLENDLRATLADLDATKKDLKIAKEAQCQQCMQLQKELVTHQEILEQLKSIVPVLNCNNGSQLTTPQKRVQLFCDAVRKIVLGDEVLHRNETETIERNHKNIRKNVVGEKLSRKNLFGVIDDELVWGATLASASYPNDENIPPTFLGNNVVLSPVDTWQENPIKKKVYNEKENVSNAISNVTPKKGIDFADDSLQSSPVLCSSNKKQKTSHFEFPQKGSPNEFYYNRVSDIVRNCSAEKTQKSPSLLNLDAHYSENITTESNKHSDKSHKTEKAMLDEKRQDMHNTKKSHVEKQQQQKETKSKKSKIEMWALKPQPSLTKLKQTTLSVTKATETVDLSKTPTFFGGIRASDESNALINESNGNYDKKSALPTALQKAVREIKTENSETEAEQEDIVTPSPTAETSKMFVKSSSAIRSKSETLKNSKSNVTSMYCSQLDETLFVPAQTSTQNHEVLSEVKKEAEEEPARDILEHLKREFETSFDRIPQKPSTSPNFKYRRQAVRKRESRQKLEGWDCAQCKNYYEALDDGKNPSHLKSRMNSCSRHRDKYQFQFNTPPGFWDVDSLSTQETVMESPKKNMRR